MSGITTVSSHSTELGDNSMYVATYVDRVQTALTDLIRDLHDMGFHWENLVLLTLSMNFGNGNTYDSTMTVEVLTPLETRSSLTGFAFINRVSLCLETMKREFSRTCDTLRRFALIPMTSVATMSMNLTLSCLHKYRITMSSRGNVPSGPRPNHLQDAPAAPHDPPTGGAANTSDWSDNGSDAPSDDTAGPGAAHLRPLLTFDRHINNVGNDMPIYGPIRRGAAHEFWLNVKKGTRS